MLRISEKSLGFLLVFPALVLLTVISIYPLVYSVYMSMQEWNYQRLYIAPYFIGADNFVHLLQDGQFLNAGGVTTLYVAMSVSIEMVLGIGLACLFYSERLRWKRVTRALILLPMMVTPVIVGFTFKALLNLQWGVLNYLLRSIGIQGIGWHTSPTQALPTIVLMDVWEWTPFVVLVTIALLSSLPREPFEAAALDGASSLQTFWHVTLPMLRDGLMMVVLIRLLDTLRDFDKIFILTRGGPMNTTDVLSVFGFRVAFLHGYVSYAAAASLVLFLIIMVIFSLLLRLTKR